jgi:hypothetical protein
LPTRGEVEQHKQKSERREQPIYGTTKAISVKKHTSLLVFSSVFGVVAAVA